MQGATASASPQLEDETTKKIYLSEKSSVQQCTVKVTNLPTDATEDVLINYFENTRRSKGGPVSLVDVDREHHTCLITFENPDGRRLYYLFIFVRLTVGFI